MSLRKRGTVWWVSFTTPNGDRVRQSSGTGNKAEAQEFHDRLKSESWRLQKLGERPRRIWNEAVVRWLHEQAHKASIGDDKSRLRWLHRYLDGKDLDDINRVMIDRITEAKLNEGASNGTVNRHLALVRAILRKCARDWEWIDKAPAVRLLKEPTRRIRQLRPEQARALIAELPEHLADMTTFDLATGLRSANLVGLTWEQVDLDRRLAWVHPDQAKARRAISVPLHDAAMAVLVKQDGKHPVFVFTCKGKPVSRGSTSAWYRALKRVGLEHFRYHDLRHVWASWHVQSGTPLFALQEMAGWETESMVRRYAHLAGDHLAKYADRMGAGTFLAQGKDGVLPAPQ